MKILNLETEEEFQKYIQSNKQKKLGEGSEGVCYEWKDGSACKIFGFEEEGYQPLDYPHPERSLSKIIMDSDIELDSYFFPTELITVQGDLRAYKTRKAPKKDYLGSNFDATEIDLTAFLDAYYDFLVQTVQLSQKNIIIYDLAFNLMYDGRGLSAIDTLDYYYGEDAMKKNLTSLEYAVEAVFNLPFILQDKPVPTIKKCGSIEEYLPKIVEMTREEQKNKQYRK